MDKMKIVVLAKQVPDTRNVGKDAMKADGTVNRGALAAIFNPEDLQALEQGLQIKAIHDAEIIVLSMGPGRAAEIIRESLYRGADSGILLTDRAFAGSDTLATSYALSMAIRKIKPNLLIAGRQAIDGDTAQVGPQVAEKLGWPQVSYAEAVEHITKQSATIRRRLENGSEKVKAPLPLVITVTESAKKCRPRHAKRLMKYKHARSLSELQNETRDYESMMAQKPYLNIPEWGVKEVGANTELLGLSGSPTKVKKIESISFQAKETRKISDDEKEIDSLMAELIEKHTIG